MKGRPREQAMQRAGDVENVASSESRACGICSNSRQMKPVTRSAVVGKRKAVTVTRQR